MSRLKPATATGTVNVVSSDSSLILRPRIPPWAFFQAAKSLKPSSWNFAAYADPPVSPRCALQTISCDTAGAENTMLSAAPTPATNFMLPLIICFMMPPPC